MVFSREELIREANRLCSTIEDAERRYKDLQEQRDELLAACKAVGDRRYKFCGFSDGGIPCGNCEACNFTQAASERLFAAIEKAEATSE